MSLLKTDDVIHYIIYIYIYLTNGSFVQKCGLSADIPHFYRKVWVIKFKFNRTPPIYVFFWRQLESHPPPQDVQISRLQTCLAP